MSSNKVKQMPIKKLRETTQSSEIKPSQVGTLKFPNNLGINLPTT